MLSTRTCCVSLPVVSLVALSSLEDVECGRARLSMSSVPAAAVSSLISGVLVGDLRLEFRVLECFWMQWYKTYCNIIIVTTSSQTYPRY